MDQPDTTFPDVTNPRSPQKNRLTKYTPVIITTLIIVFILPLFIHSAIAPSSNFRPNSQAATPILSLTPATPVILYSDSFDNLSQWTIISSSSPSNTISTSNTQSFRTNSSLRMNFSNPSGSYLHLMKNLSSPVTNAAFRIFFYDPSGSSSTTTPDTTLGTMFEIKKNPTDPNGTNEGTGLGVRTNLSTNGRSGLDYYVYRIANSSGMYVTKIHRSVGWHIFEIIVTDQGTYAKIDNQLLKDDTQTPWVNKTQTIAGSINLVSTWSLTGESFYDELSVIQNPVPTDTNAWQSNTLTNLKNFYDTYKNTNFDSLITNQLWSSDIRALSETALTFYKYGQLTNNSTAMISASAIFSKTVSNFNQSFSTTKSGWDWQQGNAMAPFTRALYAMQGSLDAATVTKAKKIISDQAQTYIPLKEDFETDLSSWTVSYQNPPLSKPYLATDLAQSGSKSLVLQYAAASGAVKIEKKFYPPYPIPTPTSPPNQSPYIPIGTSMHYEVWFYDNPINVPAIATGFFADLCDYNSGQTSCTKQLMSSGIIIDTSVLGQFYGFRAGGRENTKSTGIARSLGWHKFEIIVNNLNGTTAKIDDKAISLSNPAQNGVNTVAFVSSWGINSNARYDNLIITRYPDSGYKGDTKAEENGWNADFLANAVNLYPTLTNLPNRDILEALGRCYAYHTITTATDTGYAGCSAKTQTVYPDFTLENHGPKNPRYQTDTIIMMERGGKSYTLAGKTIPDEFKHNVIPLYNSLINYIDFNSYHFKNSPEIDWSGAHNTFFDGGLSAALYAKELGANPGFSFADFASKRHLFYYGITSDYIKSSPTSITNSYAIDNNLQPYINRVTTYPGIFWWLNGISTDLYSTLDLIQYYP